MKSHGHNFLFSFSIHTSGHGDNKELAQDDESFEVPLESLNQVIEVVNKELGIRNEGGS